MTHSLYSGGLLHGKNIRIAKIIIFRIYEIFLLLGFQLLVLPPHIVHNMTQLNRIFM